MSDSDLNETNPHAISRLMELSDAPQELWKPEELGEILTHQLSMPASAASFGSVSNPASENSTQTLRQLFEDPNPSIELLHTIRRAAKADCSSSSALLPRDAAMIIYYASIAAGLVQLQQRISDLDDAKLSQAFTWSLKRRWLDNGLRELFSRASQLVNGPPAASGAPPACQ